MNPSETAHMLAAVGHMNEALKVLQCCVAAPTVPPAPEIWVIAQTVCRNCEHVEWSAAVTQAPWGRLECGKCHAYTVAPMNMDGPRRDVWMGGTLVQVCLPPDDVNAGMPALSAVSDLSKLLARKARQ